ncbi:hypothetical protein PENTCL1PPCAC_18738, partial [Pristionchus entomophagus]
VFSSTFQDQTQRKKHRLQKHPEHDTVSGICSLCGDPASNLFDFADHFNENHAAHLPRFLSHASTLMGMTPETMQVGLLI